jgi:class 3 adenylate cyclase/tetratricopeptide (TPR) repeat protein
VACAACGAGASAGGRFCPQCGAPLSGAPPAESRKAVSVLFVDLVGSTELAERLDPEPLRQVLDRYFAACTAVIAEYRGEVEKFIGDAVVAAFGTTLVREDDAMRAVRSAAGILDALRALRAELAASHHVALQARCGVYSGDVMVVTVPGGGFRVVGDAVNTASRLQNAAGPGEILIGERTAALVRGQLSTEPLPPLALKGKAQPVPAWRVVQPLQAVRDAAAPLAPLLGRGQELATLSCRLAEVTERRQPVLLTVLGAPGVGKSRLVREFLAGETASGSTVLSARCTSYARGLSYEPLAGLLRSGPGGWETAERLLLAGPGDGPRAAATLATVLGAPNGGEPGPAGVEEISWAARRLIERLARDGTVVIVWEDLHWAEPTLLELIGDIDSWLAGVPALQVCVARNELLDACPGWGEGGRGAATLEVGPLDDQHSAALVAALIGQGDPAAHAGDDVSAQVVAACDGNPLFAELMVDVLAGAVPGTQVPPTVAALLGARLDQLPGDERRILEMAAVVGGEFTEEDLRDLCDGPGGPSHRHAVASLVRRRILRPAGTAAFRFDQTLMRDTAYAFTPKSRREQWHQRLARGLAVPGGDRLALAYHAEAARELHRELRPGEPALPDLSAMAARALLEEGGLALARKDLPAALALLARGRTLLPAGDPRHARVALRACDAAIALGDPGQAEAALAAAEKATDGEPRTAAACAVQRLITALRLGLASGGEVAAGTGSIAARLDGDQGDDLGWCRFHQLRAYLHLEDERAGSADEEFELALGRAGKLADDYEEERLLCARCEVAQWAPVPVARGLELCEGLTARLAANRALQVPVLVASGRLLALGGDLDAARRSLASALAYAGDLRLDLADAVAAAASGFVEALAGDHPRAEEHYRRGLAIMADPPGQPAARAMAAEIARALLAQRRAAEAAAFLDQAEAGADAGPVGMRIVAGALRALIAAGSGNQEAALRQAEGAAVLAAGTQDPCLRGEALFALARVRRATGLDPAASAAAAVEQFEAKGAVLPAAGVRRWLAGGSTDWEGWP